MALPTNRQEFIQNCLRRLGAPVIEINVSPDQIEDRVDEAISFWKEYHFDGTEKLYYSYQVTATDITNEYITLPEEIIGVVRVLSFAQTAMSSGMFSAQYQFMLNNANQMSGNVKDYWTAMENLQFMDYILNGLPMIRFHRHNDILRLDTNWTKLTAGDYIVIECYQEMSPETYSDAWKDKWLLRYTTALIKRQWGINLSKYEGMTLPGGVSFNGSKYYDDAVAEISQLEEEMLVSYSLPPDMMQG